MSEAKPNPIADGDIIGVGTAVNLKVGRTVAKGAHVVGKTLTVEEAQIIANQPRWGRRIEESDAGLFGGFAGVPGNEFPAVGGAQAVEGTAAPDPVAAKPPTGNKGKGK